MKTKKTLIGITKLTLSLLVACSVLTSCTDLEIEPTDSFATPNFQGVTDPPAFVDGLYASLRAPVGEQNRNFALAEVTSDAALVPTRGGDWGDNGLWRQMHQHNWTADHPYFTQVFNEWNRLHFQAGQIVNDLTIADPEIKANGHFLRALGVFVILDNFRQVPFRDPTLSDLTPPITLSPQESIDLIVSDLNTAIAGLPDINAQSGNNGRPGKAAARYLLAKVLLNKHVYLETTPDNADMNQIISLVDQIETEGNYALQAGFFDIFRDSPDNETIWSIDTSNGNRMWNGLHYNQAPEIAGGGWNGFSTLAEYYDLFEGDPNTNTPGSGQEERRGFVPTEGVTFSGAPGTSESVDFPGFESGSNVGFGFLIGQQYEIDGTPLTDRQGGILNFTRDFVDGNSEPNLINNSEITGIRVMKYNPRYGGFVSHQPFFRFADAHLMRAEALWRSGGDATPEVNELRLIRGATPLGSVGAQELIDERGRELYQEQWRRQDLVRFGQYTRDWFAKDASAINNNDRRVFPIPTSQLVANPNLVQNPGY